MILVKLFTTKLFDLKQVIIYTSVFAAGVILINVTAKILSLFIEFGFSTYWPFGIFMPRIPTVTNVMDMFLALFVFTAFVWNFSKIRSKISYLYISVIVLIMLSNLVQGYHEGFVRPVAGGETKIQNYNEALNVINTLNFLSNFEDIQPNLLRHSQNHPPGATLIYYPAIKLELNPEVISLLLLMISAGVSILALNKLFRKWFSQEETEYASFLYFLIPSIQIYYLSSLDALIASFLLLALSYFAVDYRFVSILGAAISLIIVFSLSFASVFILPVLFGYEFFRHKSVKNSLIILAVMIFFYIMLYFATGFNYINSFFIASQLENTHGFLLFYDPVSYVFSRIESILEILIFFGPFLIIAAVRGLPALKKNHPDLFLLTLLGTGSLMMMFLAGAYRIGESARAAMFIYPYLLFPVISHLKEINAEMYERNQLLALVFVQALVMQLFGDYFW